MKNTDDVHKLTDTIYKNLQDNFTSCVRQILITGKAYYKALQGVTNTAHAYNEALGRLGTAAKLCRGGTEEIGEAILQIAEAQREIHAHHEESRKALFTELILPLEQKLEKDFKKAHTDARKYSQGHKIVMAPYNKAYDSLKKFRKKTKNKYVYDTEKEAHIMRTMDKCQEKLDEYRIQGFRQALLEERRCHCFIMQRLCSMSHMSAITHRHGLDLYASLPDWEDVCGNPQMLPRSAETLLAMHIGEENIDALNGVPAYSNGGNGFLHREPRDTQSLANGFGRSRSTHDIFRQSGHFDGTKTLPPRTPAPTMPPSGAQVQAMYSFEASVRNQLSFTDGDIITVFGEISDGWQYGQNMSTQQLGWLPLSFTKPLVSGRASPDIRAGRYKSVGDLLDSRSLSEHVTYAEHEVPGNVRRPKSLYESHPQSPIHHGHSVPQAVRSSVLPQLTYSHLPTYTHYPQPLFYPNNPGQLYQSVPHPPEQIQLHTQYTRADEPMPQYASNYSPQGQPKDTNQSVTTIHSPQISPPFPPPPPPLTSAPSAIPPQTTADYTFSHAATAGHPGTGGVRSMTPPPAPAVPAPPPPPPPPPAHSSSATLPLMSSQATSSRPSVSSKSILSQQSPSSNHVYSSPARRQPLNPPPPPPTLPHRYDDDDGDDGGIDEAPNFQSNPMFSSVSLRRTKTNDRSAPKI